MDRKFHSQKEKFTVYCTYKTPNVNLEQKKNDTLIQYKIAHCKTSYNQLEVIKLTTKSGKIIREGYYTGKNNTLTVVTDSYDYYNATRITYIYT